MLYILSLQDTVFPFMVTKALESSIPLGGFMNLYSCIALSKNLFTLPEARSVEVNPPNTHTKEIFL